MDQKVTEEKMLAITEGTADESRGNSSYALMPSDRKAIAETRSSAGGVKCEIAEVKAAFGNKGSWGLWWDAKGIFSSSNKEDVINHMEKHRKFYEAVVTFTEMVEKGDKKSYKTLLDLYEDLSILEEEAKLDAKNNKSKAICRMLRKFLNEKYKLDHNLKRVECVVLKQKIDDVEKACERSQEAFTKMEENVKKLLDENRELREDMRDMARREAEKEERHLAEMDELKKDVGRKMEELSMDANRRAEEANRKSEARVQKMAEQNQRELQKISQMLASMKNYNNFP